MPFSDAEILDSYLEDVSKYCPERKVRGVWQNTVRKSGRLPDGLMTERIDRIVTKEDVGLSFERKGESCRTSVNSAKRNRKTGRRAI